MNMSTSSRFLVLALATFTLTAGAPTVAEACGPYGMTAAKRKAIEFEKSERKRLAKLRATRSDRCVAGTVAKITEEERNEMSDLPWDAKERRSVAVHYPLFSEDDYGLSLYMTGVTLNRFGFMWSQLNSAETFGAEYLALRPAGDGEWMVVGDFKSECPQPVDADRYGMQQFESL